jgi:stress response protein YsnF
MNGDPLDNTKLYPSLQLSTINKDSLFQICSNPIAFLIEIYRAAMALQHNEIYALDPHMKIIILKLLCNTCYSTEQFQQVLEQRNDETMKKYSNLLKLNKEKQQKLKEISSEKREKAIEMCKTDYQNMIHKKDDQKNHSNKIKKSKNVKNHLSDYVPTVAQINAKLEEIVIMEKLGKCAID